MMERCLVTADDGDLIAFARLRKNLADVTVDLQNLVAAFGLIGGSQLAQRLAKTRASRKRRLVGMGLGEAGEQR